MPGFDKPAKSVAGRQDYRRWRNSKLSFGGNNIGVIGKLSDDQKRFISPTRIGLCTRPHNRIYGERLQVKSHGHGHDHSQDNTSRPHMKLNLDGPAPTSYSPAANPPSMRNAPAYTIRPKTYPEKDGGDRVAWAKEWFSNCDRWSLRTNFNPENTWPSPADYAPKPTIGWPQMTLPQAPSHSIQKRRDFTLVGKDARNFPSPNSYDRSRSHNKILASSPCFSIQQGRRNGTLPFIAQGWSPGPGSYNPDAFKTSQKIRKPAFTISKSPRLIGITRNYTF